MLGFLWKKINDFFRSKFNININKTNSPTFKKTEKIIQKKVGRDAIIIKNK